MTIQIELIRITYMYCIISDGPRPSELLGGGGGGGSHPDPEIRGARSSTNIFSALQASVWSEKQGVPSPGSTTYCITEFSYHWSFVLSRVPCF